MRPLWEADLGCGLYRNPILYADYSDPDVIRTGHDFYMTASTFSYVPGLPILHSTDLVHWTVVNYAVRKIPDPRFEKPVHGGGIWAPAIREHDGLFYIFVGDPDVGILETHTADIRGTWSPLHVVKSGSGFIDPCPFWDEDGKAYVVHAYAKSRAGFNSRLAVFEMSPDGEHALTEDRIIFDGTGRHPTIEGPKMYRFGDRYYILAPAGGVETGWETALRSGNIYGPYEDQIVLSSGSTGINGPHQGGLVDTPDGAWWFIHFQDQGPYGRLTHLQPVTWKDGWPMMGEKGHPVRIHEKPYLPQALTYPASSDAFEGDQLGLQWQWQANPKDNWYRMGSGALRLNCLGSEPLYDKPNVLTQLIQTPAFAVTVKAALHRAQEGDMAGLGLLGGCTGSVALKKLSKGYVVLMEKNDCIQEQQPIVNETLQINMIVQLRMVVAEGCVASFFYRRSEQEAWQQIGTAYAGARDGWSGCRIGLYAQGAGRGEGCFRDLRIERI